MKIYLFKDTLFINYYMINKLIIGTAQFGLDYGITNKSGKISENELDLIFDFCNNKNILLFDTAQDYGTSEDIIKNYKHIYSNFKIITKAKFTNKNILETINLSFDKFKFIDYFLLHSFDDFNELVIDELIKLKTQNKIGKIGVSVYTVDEAIKCLQNNNVNAIQIPFNYLDTQWFDQTFQNLLKVRSIEIHVRSIFLQGLLLNPIIKTPSNIPKEDFENLNKIIGELCELFGLSNLELCFAYTNSFDWISKFLIGIDNYDHLHLNYSTINKNLSLTNEQLNIIHEKIINLNPLITNPSKWVFTQV